MRVLGQNAVKEEEKWQATVIDADGFRANVGIIIADDKGRLLIAKRIVQDAWQFPQGGIGQKETPEAAMYRELHEELGLHPDDVRCLGRTERWLRYRLPKRYIRRNKKPLCIGQKQIWFLLRLVADEASIRFDVHEAPEFERWQWVDTSEPVDRVIYFKRDVYRRALDELMPLLAQAGPAAV